jgi:hypothetical protein
MELKKLSTKRLLALLKSKRRLEIHRVNLIDEYDGSKYNEMYRREVQEAHQLLADIKAELSTREHVERK